VNSRSANPSFRVLCLGVAVALAWNSAGCSPSDSPSPHLSSSNEQATTADAGSKPPHDSSPEQAFETQTAPSRSIRFEQSTDCGVNFRYYGNPSTELYMTEQNGGGVAIFDFDRDGSLDVFFSNGNHHDRPSEEPSAQHHLYRNTSRSAGRLRFQNVGPSAGVSENAFGMGVVAGDMNNDGFPDLFLCCYGKGQIPSSRSMEKTVLCEPTCLKALYSHLTLIKLFSVCR
jgi:hypothetical protein